MFEGARKSLLLGMSLLAGQACVSSAWAQAQTPTPGQNVNMVSGTKWPGGDPFLRQQNEPSIAVSTRNPQHLLAGANDYRTVDLNLVDQLPINQLAGDAWLGVFKSFDGGQRWQSTLLPGFPQDGSTFGASSPMKGFAAASDPTVRAGTNGMFYYSGIALNRNTNIGGLFFARFIDLNNKENGDATQSCTPGQPCIPVPTTDPIRYIDTREIDAGNAGQFIDKPWIAVDIPRSGALNCTINTTQQIGVDSNGNPITAPVTQTFPGGNVYIAYAMFVGGTINIRSKIKFSKSIDCGATWTKPIMISQTYDINQGTQVAVDPETGYVYVAWRVFSGSGNDPDAIVITKSTDGGNTFTKAVPVRTLTTYTGSAGPAMFDQNTSATEFRDQTMPTLAVDDSGRVGVPGNVYVAWAERGVGPSGDARIRISTSSDGVTWPSTPTNVDNSALIDDFGNLIDPSAGGRGHQLMPAMTFIGGNLMIVYYDLRLDATTGVFTPTNPFGSKGQFFEESRPYVGDPLASVFTPFVDDNGLTVRRHTMDVMVAQSNGGPNPSFTTARLSRYDFGLPGLNDLPGGLPTQQLEQLKLNPPNLPMFAGGTVPFMGDYVDIAGQEFVTCTSTSTSSSCPKGWRFNNPAASGVAAASSATNSPASSPIYFGTWTTNQDVIPPADGVSWTKYTAPPQSAQTTSTFNGQPLPPCTTGYEGDRNQNIYESRITQGLYVSSPQNSKPLSTTLQRAFVILVQNSTNAQREFQLSIAPPQPPGAFNITGQTTLGGFASFEQAVPNQPSLPNPLPAPVTTALATIPAHSGATRTVFALSSSQTATITVNVNEVQIDMNGNPIIDINGNPVFVSGGLSSFIVLNADGTVPTLVDADGVPANTSIGGVEIYTPSIGHPTVVSPSIGHPSIGHPSIGHPGVGSPSIGHTGVVAPSIGHPGVPSTSVTDAVVTNTSLADPSITACNDSVDPNSCVADARYTITNDGGNTTAAFTVSLTGGTTLNVPLQLAVVQTYTTQTAQMCALVPQQQDITNTNVNNPSIGHPSIGHPAPTDATILLAPGDSAQIILRGKTDVTTMGTIITQIAPVVVPQAINTNSTATTPPVIAPLFITTASLSDGVVPVEGTTTFGTLSAIGGNLSPTCVGTWTLIGAPAGLSLSSPALFTPGNPGVSSVTLSGNPAPGTYTFTAQVQDCGPASIATRQFTLRIAAPLMVTTASPLSTATQGVTPSAISFTATGGIGPYNWTPVTVNGMTLNSSGVFSGTPAMTGTFPFTAQVTDSASPSQTASRLMTLSVVPATPPPPPSSVLLCDTFNFATVTQQAGGPPSPTTCSFSVPTKITQVATYHYNNGTGATPGTISLTSGNQTFGPFQTVGVAGQGGPNEAWVATPNVIVPAGVITVIDSGSATWSYNTGSNNSGFVREWGFPVQVSTLTFLTQPTSTPAGAHVFPAVQVQALDSNNQPLPFIAVTIGLGTNPGNGTLSGTLTQTTSQQGIDPSPFGIATFPDLAIDTIGTGYTLRASVNQITATSNQFSITNPCAAFPAGVVPFTTIYYVTRDSAGDAFIVGALVGGTTQVLQSVQLPSLQNQQFCNPVTLETNYTVPAYVPTAAERVGDFTAYAGLALIDPANGAPFPTPNVIPPNRLGSLFAWRIPPHSSTLPRLSCSLEPTLHSIEGNVATSIQFANNTAGSVNVYWINYQGQRVLYLAGLASGQSFNQGTFITHPWIVTDATSNACLGIWLPTESPGVAAITGIAISSVNLSSTTVTIGGANVPYTAVLSNGTGTTVSNALVQAYIDQGTASRGAGGSVLTCVPTLGDLPPGSCIFNFSVVASNSNAGNGTLVPGTANARFELRGPNGLLDVFTVPVTLAAAASSGSRYLIVADGRSSPSSIFRIVPDGSSTALVATLATGRAIAVSIDQTTNTLYSADPFHAEVWKVSLWGGAVLPLFAGAPLASPVAVTVDSAGNVYVGDNSTDAVSKITPAGALTLFANLPASPGILQDIRMAFDASGNLLVGSDFVGGVTNVCEIDQISPTGVSTTVYNSASMNGGTAIKEIGGLAIDASGNIIVADYASSSIVKIASPGTPAMTATTLITNASLGGSTAITGLTVVDSAAGIYDVTANFANKILSVNTSTNTITTLVSGAPLTYPTDISISGFIPSPQPATNVTPVVNFSAPSVTLNWTASTSAVTGYNVYRKRNGGAFAKIASVPATSTSYTDTGVAFGDSLDYYVTSVDSSNVESVPSNVVHTGIV